MPASVSPPTISAADTAPEPNHYQEKAIKILKKRGARPLDITPGHIQEDHFVLGSLQIIADLINIGKQNGIDLQVFLPAFMDLGMEGYVHYARIIVSMPRGTLLKGDQAVDKDMTSLRAPSGSSPLQLPKSGVPAKRNRAEFEATDKENAIIGADKKSTMLLLDKFCGPGHGCKRSPEDYQYRKGLLNHVEDKHVKNLPSRSNPIWCCDIEYADMKLYLDHHLDTHKIRKGAAPGAMPPAAPTPENDSPLHHNRNPRDTDSASLPGATFSPNASANVYPNATTLPPTNIGPAHGVSNSRSSHGYAAERLRSGQDVGAEDYVYSQPSPDQQTWQSSQFPPPATVHNGYPANHS